ncbi:MAG: glycosyltransferase family 2 protein [Planctomycetota bacterium]
MGAPRLSVLIPTWNGEAELRALLPALVECEGADELELVAIDSSSSDRSVELLREHGARVEVIPQSEFGHGRTRNRLAEQARGELLVFLSQDVVPGPGLVRHLAAPFDDPRVAGASARVLPFSGDDPLATRTVLDLHEASEQAVVRDLDHVAGIWELAPAERGAYLRFNNVASAIRADVFRELPFPDVSFGEDFAWAARALTAGWRVAYAPAAVAHHAHAYGMGSAFRRYRIDAEFHAQIHGWRLRPSLLSAARGALYEIRRDLEWLGRERPRGALGALLRSPGLRVAQVLGQYAGSRGTGPRVWRGSA